MTAEPVVAPCTCEEFAHGDMNVVAGGERLARILTDRHINKQNKLKPSAFPLSHIREAGLSLVRVDKVDAAELNDISNDICRLSGASALKGALLGSAASIRAMLFEGTRALCVKDDPVLNDKQARDNPAHAVSVATRRISEEDAKEIRAHLLDIFFPVQTFAEIYSQNVGS